MAHNIIHFYSTKRQEEFKEFQAFVNAEEQKLLKHCPTRWLSLTRCLPRIINQYEALKSYFGAQPDVDKPRSKVRYIFDTLEDPLTPVWFSFILFVLEPYSNFNGKFQVGTASLFNKVCNNVNCIAISFVFLMMLSMRA